MKKILAVAALVGSLALADTVTTPANNSFVNIPVGFASNTNAGNTPYWNNPSQDGSQMNIGYFLTNTGTAFSSGTVSPAPVQYLANTNVSNNAPSTSFSLVRQAASFNITILYQNASANSGLGGTSIGIYDVSNPNNKVAIYTAGTVPANVNVNKNVATSTIGGTGAYGFYATSCQASASATNCFTFYSDTSLNPAVNNVGNPFAVEGPSNPHQHFALFTMNGNPNAWYLGYEDSLSGSGFVGAGGTENIGDYNDIIFSITSAVPEPATSALIGVGLLILGFSARRRVRS